jgi:hypothetical protein
MRLIVHAGFPKTATSTLQATLRQNRPRMPAGVVYVPHDDEAVRAARRWAIGVARNRRNDARRWFRRSFGRILDAAVAQAPEVLVLSAEDFCGGMPGTAHARWFGCSAALAEEMTQTARARGFSPELVYSIRAREDWLRSIHRQLCMNKRRTKQWEDWLLEPGPSGFDWAPVLEEIESAAPAPVHVVELETDRRGIIGPGSALMALAGVREDTLRQFTVSTDRNVGPDKRALTMMQSRYVRSLPAGLRRMLRTRWKTRGR